MNEHVPLIALVLIQIYKSMSKAFRPYSAAFLFDVAKKVVYLMLKDTDETTDEEFEFMIWYRKEFLETDCKL